jgi:TM2 domain-containing membrane protein YozV
MGSGSCGNVIAALASFFIPGLGQLLQGRWLLAGFMFVMTALLWLILLGWITHLWSIIDAAVYRRAERWERGDHYAGRYGYRRA